MILRLGSLTRHTNIRPHKKSRTCYIRFNLEREFLEIEWAIGSKEMYFVLFLFFFWNQLVRERTLLLPRGRQSYLPHSLPLWPHHHIQQFKVRKASQRELKWNCFRAWTTPSREAWLYDRPDDRRCDVVDNSRAFSTWKNLKEQFFFVIFLPLVFLPRRKKIRENKMSWTFFFLLQR